MTSASPAPITLADCLERDAQDPLRLLRDQFALPLSDQQACQVEFLRPASDSPEMKYLHARRESLGGYLPKRNRMGPRLSAPDIASLHKFLDGTHNREQSTTMAFVQLLAQWLRDPTIGSRIVPIVADEARTFGMQSLFRQVAIYSSVGQL